MWKTWLAAPVAVAVLGISLGFAAVLKSDTGRRAWSAASGAVTSRNVASGISQATGTGVDDRLAALEASGEAGSSPVAGPGRSKSVAADAADLGRIALVIGNANYADDGATLAQPVNDARAMAEELRGRGFEVIVGENLTRHRMEETIEAFKARVTPRATALIF